MAESISPDAIRKRREELGLSQGEVAKYAKTTQQTVDKIEKGNIRFSRFMGPILERLGINQASSGNVQNGQNGQSPLPDQPIVGERDLPVYSAIEGGEGALIVSSEPVDHVLRPAPLAKVRDGYGIIVTGESMVPAFEPGDTVLVNPHLPPVRDCDVVLYGKDSKGNEIVTVKRLLRFNDSEWHLRRHNPAEGEKKDFSLSRKIWPKCHRVVGKYSRR